jgi:hypothetical protein
MLPAWQSAVLLAGLLLHAAEDWNATHRAKFSPSLINTLLNEIYFHPKFLFTNFQYRLGHEASFGFIVLFRARM